MQKIRLLAYNSCRNTDNVEKARNEKFVKRQLKSRKEDIWKETFRSILKKPRVHNNFAPELVKSHGEILSGRWWTRHFSRRTRYWDRLMSAISLEQRGALIYCYQKLLKASGRSIQDILLGLSMDA